MDRINLLLKENFRLLVGTAVVVFVTALIVSLVLGNKKTTKIIVNNKTFVVAVARTDQEKQIGLSKKNKLDENSGMLFVFDNPDYYSFWMKEMKFPIDIIYINGNKVITVIKNAKPSSSSSSDLTLYKPDEKSDKVLELNAGTSRKYNIKKGTIVKVENL